MMQIAEHFYTMTEAAELLQVDRVTIRRWIDSGKLDAQRAGRVTFVDKRQVDTLKGTISHTPLVSTA